jgi:hypothetical protein
MAAEVQRVGGVPGVARLARRQLGSGTTRFRMSLMGVGGVGSNVLGMLAKVGCGRVKVTAYDHDTVEFHNLNRTLAFQLTDASAGNVPKVQAVERRWPNFVTGVKRCVEAADPMPKGSVIVDARDTLDPGKLLPGTWAKLAYDGGTNISVTWNPAVVASRILDIGGTSSYAVVPSFYVPAALLAALAIRFLEFENLAAVPERCAGTLHIDIDETIRSNLAYKWRPDSNDAGSDSDGSDGSPDS